MKKAENWKSRQISNESILIFRLILCLLLYRTEIQTNEKVFQFVANERSARKKYIALKVEQAEIVGDKQQKNVNKKIRSLVLSGANSCIW